MSSLASCGANCQEYGLVASLFMGVTAGWLTASYLLEQNIWLAAAGVVFLMVASYPIFENLFAQVRLVKENGPQCFRSMNLTSVLFGGVLSGLIFKLASIKHMFLGYYVLYILATRVI